jgi:hypothetical protein
MKYLEEPKLSWLSAFLAGCELGDRTLECRLEAFSCKRAGADKKLAKELERQLSDEAACAPTGSPPMHFSPPLHSPPLAPQMGPGGVPGVSLLASPLAGPAGVVSGGAAAAAHATALPPLPLGAGTAAALGAAAAKAVEHAAAAANDGNDGNDGNGGGGGGVGRVDAAPPMTLPAAATTSGLTHAVPLHPRQGRSRSGSLCSGETTNGSPPAAHARAPSPLAGAAGDASAQLGSLADAKVRRLLIDLISTMNASFPDYDFRSLKLDSFTRERSLPMVMAAVNTRLGEVVADGGGRGGAAGEQGGAGGMFLGELWRTVEEVIRLRECEIFVFLPDLSEGSEATPFGDGASLWAFNYFFFNPGLKKVLYFSAQARSSLTTAGRRGMGRARGGMGPGGMRDDDMDDDMDDEGVAGTMMGDDSMAGADDTWASEDRNRGPGGHGDDSVFEHADPLQDSHDDEASDDDDDDCDLMDGSLMDPDGCPLDLTYDEDLQE